MKAVNKQENAISSLFNRIAPRYDRFNHSLSFGVDVYWRKQQVRALGAAHQQKVLDLACGTGDLTLALLRRGWQVTGVDLSEGMLRICQRKVERWCHKHGKPLPPLLQASAQQLPFADASFQALTIAFGIRNFDQRSKCLQEIYRVLHAGGSLSILEFAIPRNSLWKALYLFYFRQILPRVARVFFAQKGAGDYLPASVLSFPQYEAFCAELQQAGFTHVHYQSLSGGIAVLYTAHKPIG